jgi:50S ribosomal protein L16 3-hydroxylase
MQGPACGPAHCLIAINEISGCRIARSLYSRRMRHARTFLGGLSPEQFLRRHWQKQPLLCRSALPSYVPPVTPDELAGLACEDDVESRLITRRGQRYTLESGPFPIERFATLGSKNWTLLVQDLDVHVPGISELLGNLDFLPSWRVDDVMASFAADGGSVGPHYDEYDVFLLQVEGKRRWQISTRYDREALVENTQLKLLSDFRPEQEWVLEPGDLLYLPPHVAHFGVAQGPCVTYSLGCRAPSTAELLLHLARRAAERKSEADRYKDADQQPTRERYAIDPASVARATALIKDALPLNQEEVARGLGTLTTLPKALFASESRTPLSAARAQKRLEKVGGLRRALGSRWSYCTGASGAYLFVDGNEYPFGGDSRFLGALCATVAFEGSWLVAHTKKKVEKQLLLDLIMQRHLE